MLDYDEKEITKLETYLKDNGYELNSDKITVYHNPTHYYYRTPLAVLFHRNEDITIKDFENNRKFQFEPTSSEEIIINFLKYLENNLVLV
jgi:hypothetical protein